MYDEMYLSIERRKPRNYNILDDTVKIDVNSLYIEKNVAFPYGLQIIENIIEKLHIRTRSVNWIIFGSR